MYWRGLFAASLIENLGIILNLLCRAIFGRSFGDLGQDAVTSCLEW